METALPLFPFLPRVALREIAQQKNAACEGDIELVRAAQRGEIAAFNELLDTHRERILNLAFQILRDRDGAEDAAQEAFVRAFSRLGDFRGEARFSTWIYRVALNVCLEKRRQLKVDVPFEPESAPSFDAAIESKMALDYALQKMTESGRVALVLREWHEMSYEEMALVLGVPVGTVRSRLHHARLEFRRIWQKMEAE
ncbi:RNA polymerase, sigma subunit, ECF family [Abditibacterium utsteinense]|uniref:RNA polymerase, sigma subunit, ECF family n=1 Tax=Abditibacterium utsteinense TaxID=1960156 RepID=A0A2S8STS7_9BACT|nr:sigma-70 family RNA polymerase sigma factor [Abditibacterium utsteinense]PQV64149.1 RNA polymerase, sigma subunit, ECF family [Abditibacterium utsteinense]